MSEKVRNKRISKKVVGWNEKRAEKMARQAEIKMQRENK